MNWINEILSAIPQWVKICATVIAAIITISIWAWMAFQNALDEVNDIEKKEIEE